MSKYWRPNNSEICPRKVCETKVSCEEVKQAVARRSEEENKLHLEPPCNSLPHVSTTKAKVTCEEIQEAVARRVDGNKLGLAKTQASHEQTESAEARSQIILAGNDGHAHCREISIARRARRQAIARTSHISHIGRDETADDKTACLDLEGAIEARKAQDRVVWFSFVMMELMERVNGLPP